MLSVEKLKTERRLLFIVDHASLFDKLVEFEARNVEIPEGRLR
jgi:hypothetical protein